MSEVGIAVVAKVFWHFHQGEKFLKREKLDVIQPAGKVSIDIPLIPVYLNLAVYFFLNCPNYRYTRRIKKNHTVYTGITSAQMYCSVEKLPSTGAYKKIWGSLHVFEKIHGDRVSELRACYQIFGPAIVAHIPAQCSLHASSKKIFLDLKKTKKFAIFRLFSL